MVKLRYYQTDAIEALYRYFGYSNGNPLVVLPTGAGKSLTLAAFIEGAIRHYPSTRIVVLTHVKELIEQDMKAIIRYWPEAPIGVWSAGLKQKRRDQVTVAGIQSVHNKPATFGGTDLVIVDEAHLIPRAAETMYGRFIAGLKSYNPHLKVIGLTATPYRMDSGMLTEGDDRVFTDIAYDINVGKLIKEGYLCPLISKAGVTKADLSGVHTRGGEYVPSELQAAMDQEHLIEGALDEMAALAPDRRHILAFCAGIDHSAHVAAAARRRGWTADYVSGEMETSERDAKIADFKAGRTRMLCNAMLLTTGFDFPSIDCIAMLRPTKSVGLYVQIMGRGLRQDGVKTNTLVLDFAGNIQYHGPIDQVRVRRKGKGDGESVAPMKVCPNCQELVHTSVMICPCCEHEWKRGPSHDKEASDAVVVAAITEPRVHAVDRVIYRRHTKTGKPDSVKVSYVCGKHEFTEWLPIEDERSYVRKHAVSWCWSRGVTCPDHVEPFLDMVRAGRVPAPDAIRVKPDGKYWRVLDANMGARRLNVSSVVERGSLLEFL